jgi:maltoporin
MDFYYLNDSGYGFGIEDVYTKFGDLSAAWITASQQSFTGETSAKGQPLVQVNKADVRLVLCPGNTFT